MHHAFRRILPALFVLAPFVSGAEPASARQLSPQAPAPAAARVAPQTNTALTARERDDSHDDARDESGAADPAAAPARQLAASAPVPAQAGDAAKIFGYNVPSFTGGGPAPDRDPAAQQQQQQQQPSGQQPSGQQPANQQPGKQPPDPIQPMTAGEKMRRAFSKAFLSPEPYAFSAFSAALTQYREDELPKKDFEDELGDWGSRFARTFATRTTRSVFTNGVYASLFRQDPRYHRPTHKGFGARLGYAVSRVFVTRGDDGDTEPNYSRFAGSMTASALANVWERSTPGHDRIGTDATLRRFGYYFLYDAISNVLFREVVPTIFGK